jgi:anti-repressor protein
MATNIVPANFGSATLSMTSREIAELTGKRHDNVLRDIDNLLETLPSELSSGFHSNTYESGDPPRPYRQFVLDRDSAYCLVAGYDAPSRMRIIKRWQELESQRVALPDFTNPVVAARAWADEVEARLIAEKDAAAKTLALEAAQPAVEFHDRVKMQPDHYSIREVAKLLRTGEKKLRQWMRDERLIALDNTPYQEYMNRGYFRQVIVKLQGGERLYSQTVVTSKGLAWLQRRIDHALMGVEV